MSILPTLPDEKQKISPSFPALKENLQYLFCYTSKIILYKYQIFYRKEKQQIEKKFIKKENDKQRLSIL